MSFKTKIAETAKSKNSQIVLALDLPFVNPKNNQSLAAKAQSILEAVHPHVCAVKFNHHLVLPLGVFDGVQKLVSLIHQKGMLAIMDAKVNDIGATNTVIAEYYFAAGFDAIIANPFVGWEDGLKPIFEVAQKKGCGVILLGYMSHKGAAEGYGQTVIDAQIGEKISQYISFARKSIKWGADGIVVGATIPEKIKEIRGVVGGKVPIYSPGVGVQGGAAKTALDSGASYLIVGREITLAEDPAKAALRLLESIKNV